MVETPSMHLQRPERTNHTSQDEVIGPITQITCVICEATYTPSDLYQRFLQVSSIVLESAYMSMCHFCFRCRRPACPECWDAVHGICGACVQEADLAFRTEVKPLDGTLFPPASKISPTSQIEVIQENSASSLFVCVKHGKFHALEFPSDDISNIRHTETVTMESTSTSPEQLPSISQVQEPAKSSEMEADSGIVRTGLALALEAAPVQETGTVKRGRSIIKKIEHVLTVIVLLAILAIAVMIGLAEYFPAVNTFIHLLLHIDIQAEIAYLLHLI